MRSWPGSALRGHDEAVVSPGSTVALGRLLEVVRHLAPWGTLATWARVSVRFLATHTGIPALLVAAVLVVAGYRLLKKTARFVVEVALVAALFAMAAELGWIRW